MPDSPNNPDAFRPSRRAELARGQPISELMSQALASPHLISLAAGFVDPVTLPAEVTRAAMDSILSDIGEARSALQYGTTAGYQPLREAILDFTHEADGQRAQDTGLSVDQVIVTAGSNQMLHLISESLFDPGDIVLCAAPSYFVYMGILANLGVRSIGVASDSDGMIPDAIEEELAALDEKGELPLVKAIYCTSYFDNPCSVNLSAERRVELVEIAKRWSRSGPIRIIEDCAYRALRYEGEDIPSIRAFDETGETVITTGTFSKCYAPGLRVGWGVLPKNLVAPVCDQKGNLDFGSPNLAQHVMLRVLEMGQFESHIQQLRSAYKKKLNAMLSAADEFLGNLNGISWIRPKGGLYVWLTLPEQIDTGPRGTLFGRANEAGVLYVPGQYCYAKEGPCQHNTIRLSFGVQPADKIRLGMEKLAGAIQVELNA